MESKELPISVSANQAARWKQGDYDVWHLKDQVVVAQGKTSIRSHEAVVWYERADSVMGLPAKLILYAEGRRSEAILNSGVLPGRGANEPSGVIIERSRPGQAHQVTGQATDRQESNQWLGRFYSDFGVQFNTPIVGPSPSKTPLIFTRGLAARKQESLENGVAAVQFQQPIQPRLAAPQNVAPSVPQQRLTPTRIDFKPRSRNPLNVRSFPSPDGNENIVLYSGGVRVTIEGQEVSQLQGPANPGARPSGRVVIEADTVIAWTNPLRQLMENRVDDSAKRWEVYLEGNIVFSTDDRVIYADRMYYDVQQKRGTILQAEMYTRLPAYEGMLRLKADVLQQIDENNARAYGTAITSSRIGVPRYWLQSEVVDLARRPRLDFNEFGQLDYDPQTGQPRTEWTYEGTSRNNFLYVLGAPLLFWPNLNGNSDQSSYYLSGLAVKNDNVFGFQTYTRWNAYQLFGIRRPPDNTRWDLNLDYLSERGLGLGTRGDYDLKDPYGFRTLNKGRFEAWGIYDNGLDNLGRGRRTLVPEKELRGRVFWQHRTRYANGFELIGETGLVSDRNFLEQYREREWDQQKDHVNRIQLKKLLEDQSFNVSASYRTSEFFTQTNQLPAINHFVLGRSLFGNRATWSSSSQVGYYNLEIADAPLDPVDASTFDPLAWEVAREGVIAGTRNEISVPIQAGPVRLAPYLLGEAIHYGEDVLGNDRDRLFGQGGIRFSLPMVSIQPQVQSELLNVNGVAHKVEWEGDLFFAESTADLRDFPLYHLLDDDAQEHFRRRFLFSSFGGTFGDDVPFRFDERDFAFRSGMQSNVTAASTEIVDDLFAARIGVNQRWQTKRGPLGNQKIVDWIVLDIQGTLFPKENRDNHGEMIGMLNYDFRWHLGDRLTILSDGYADVFSQGLKTISLGARLNRPEVGNVFVGFRSIEGPISANVLNAQINHRLADKWAMTLGTSIDFASSGNLGQRFAISRIGESAIIRAGVNVDVSRGTTGFNFLILPRFVPGKALRRSIGVDIPALGARGIE
ncbi:MAG: organic solvent tolerance protein OstA [Planctomycetota bacterium]|nr:organic solvent tolerance protein OstA [Planctomycetota bacterium]